MKHLNTNTRRSCFKSHGQLVLLEAAGASNHMSIWCFKYTAHVFMHLKHFHFEALQEALHEAPLEKGTPPAQNRSMCVVTLWVVWRLNIVLHYSSDEIYRVRSDDVLVAAQNSSFFRCFCAAQHREHKITARVFQRRGVAPSTPPHRHHRGPHTGPILIPGRP